MARDVLEDRLRLRAAREIEADLERNYADDVVLSVAERMHPGKDRIRESISRLHAQLRDRRYEYPTCPIEGKMEFLEWKT